jgi:hypothetical protein
LLFSNNFASVRNTLEKIPQEDLESLKKLFVFLDLKHFAYTLFGNKPVSLAAKFVLTPYQDTLYGFPCERIFWKQWEVWEQYKNYFPIKKYLFIKEASVCSTKNFIILINKKEFTKTIQSHLRVFEEILKSPVDPYLILEKLEKGEVTFQESIQNNELLLGILLGYGKHNAELYCRYEYCSNILSNKKRSYLHNQDDYSLVIERPVGFIADPNHSETITLAKRYHALRGFISAIYAKGDFLEITLRKLTEEPK